MESSPISANLATTTPTLADNLLAALAQFSQQRFANQSEMLKAVLGLVAAQLGVRTPFLATTQANRFEVLDVVNFRGCTLEAGTILPLEDSY